MRNQGVPHRLHISTYLCTACRRCRIHTRLHGAWGRFWCAYCQAVQEFVPVPGMPQMGRTQAPAWEKTA